MLASSQTIADESQSIRDRFPFEPERVHFKFTEFYLMDYHLITNIYLL